jgi:hypothetical protein
MDSPQWFERRGIRYSLNLPVSLTLAHKELHGRSENISLGGILLSSALLLPEGSMVEVAVGVAHLPQPGTQLSTRGKVVRVREKATGFAMAIEFERAFEFSLQGLSSGSNCEGKGDHFPQEENGVITSRRLHLAWAWHMET